MASQANMDLIKFVYNNCLIKEDIDDSQPLFPVCLAILARMSMKFYYFSYSF